MGFLSCNLRFYTSELQQLEQTPPTPEHIERARRLLRMLDDLAGEGYSALGRSLEEACSGVSRLRSYLRQNHAAPFAPPPSLPAAQMRSYSGQETELRAAVQQAMQAAAAMPQAAAAPLTGRLCQFCRWIGYDSRAAYVFLLRDALLPFAFYAARDRSRIFPWLLGRSSFAALTGQPDADDAVRASVYRALEHGCEDGPSFFSFVLPDIRQTMLRYPSALKTLRAMLAGIDAERIFVVESGCAGTFPLLLMSLDSRVEMRMYTTYPYLSGVFGPRIFTQRYEESRMFETMASQALYFRFSGLRDGLFYVRTCTDRTVRRQALAELRTMLPI